MHKTRARNDRSHAAMCIYDTNNDDGNDDDHAHGHHDYNDVHVCLFAVFLCHNQVIDLDSISNVLV